MKAIPKRNLLMADGVSGTDVIGWLTSSKGAFAAVAALVALLVGLKTLVGPAVARRRAAREAAGSLRLIQVDIGTLYPWQRSRELRFQVSNAGRSTCVLTAVRLRVTASRESEQERHTIAGAPVQVHKYRIELEPDKTEYDVRSRLFSPAEPPLSVAEGETEAFVVKLISQLPRWYEIVISLDWFDTKTPDETHCLTSEPLEADFPQDQHDSGSTPWQELQLLRDAMKRQEEQAP